MRQIIGPGAILAVDSDTGTFTLHARDNDREPYEVPCSMKRAVALVASRTAFNAARVEGDARAQYNEVAKEPKLNTLSGLLSRETKARTHAAALLGTLEALLGEPLYVINESGTGRTRPVPLTEAERRELETLTWGDW